MNFRELREWTYVLKRMYLQIIELLNNYDVELLNSSVTIEKSENGL